MKISGQQGAPTSFGNGYTASSGVVSKTYYSVLSLQYTFIPANHSWEREGLAQPDWDVVWSRCFTASKTSDVSL